MTGVLIVDKPAGWTSSDVVCKLRGVLRLRQGHKQRFSADFAAFRAAFHTHRINVPENSDLRAVVQLRAVPRQLLTLFRYPLRTFLNKFVDTFARNSVGRAYKQRSVV